MNFFTRFRSLFILFLVVCFALAAFAASDESVKVQQGLVSGMAGKNPDVTVYRGIPYAAPPVGDLRWKAPQPPVSWKDTREAKQFGNSCPQTSYPSGSIYQSKPEPMSEDCLYLNIWTPSGRPKHASRSCSGFTEAGTSADPETTRYWTDPAWRVTAWSSSSLTTGLVFSVS